MLPPRLHYNEDRPGWGLPGWLPGAPTPSGHLRPAGGGACLAGCQVPQPRRATATGIVAQCALNLCNLPCL